MVGKAGQMKHLDTLIRDIRALEEAIRKHPTRLRKLEPLAQTALAHAIQAERWHAAAQPVQMGLIGDTPPAGIVPVPYVSGSDTSTQAAARQSRSGKARKDTMRILVALERRPQTVKELRRALNLEHQTCSARVSEAVNSLGWAYYSEARRDGAAVVCLTKAGREHLRRSWKEAGANAFRSHAPGTRSR